MKIRFSLLFLFVGIGFWMNPGEVNAARRICGVSVKSGRCFRELRRLKRGCQNTPKICGRTYHSNTTPRFRVVRTRCLRLRRRSRALWNRGLCGVRLFSHPKTYCGAKGIEVAVACLKASQQNTPQAAPVLGSVTPKSKSEPHSPLPSTRTVTPPKQAHDAKQGGLSRSSVATARLTTPPPSSGTSYWLIILQLLTMALVIYLLVKRRPTKNSEKSWKSSNGWEPTAEILEGVGHANEHQAHREMERVATSVEKLEDRFQDWKDSFEEQMERASSSMHVMQSQADALFSYYVQLAQQIIETSDSQNPDGSDVRQHLLSAKGKLQWLFNAHRELPSHDSPIDELKAASWHHVQRLLETLGHVSWELKLHDHMGGGHFTATEFMERKSIDQAQRFVAGQELQSFMDLGEEFLACLERVYRGNLNSLKIACELEIEALSPEQEMQLFFRDYVLDFLLEDLPLLLQELTHRSSPVNSGALVDQFICFIESELKESGIELFPILEEEMIDTNNARLIYLLHAGARLAEDSSVTLRRPNPSIMAVKSEAPDSQPEPIEPQLRSSGPVSASIQTEAFSSSNQTEAFSSSKESELKFEVDITGTGKISWFDAPVDDKFIEGEVPAGNSNQRTASAPSIAHPDSDPPELTSELGSVSPEHLPHGPLPHIKDATQGFVQAVSEGDLPHKITSEYSSLNASSGPDEN